MARLAVLLSVSRRLQDLGRVRVRAQPRDEDRAQRLRRDGDASVTLEQTAHPLRPAARLHGAVEARLRRVKQVGLVASHLKFEQRVILVQDWRQSRWQRGGERAVEARGLVAVSLTGEVHHPAAAWLALECVPKAQPTDAAYAVRRDEGEQ